MALNNQSNTAAFVGSRKAMRDTRRQVGGLALRGQAGLKSEPYGSSGIRSDDNGYGAELCRAEHFRPLAGGH